MKFKGNHSSDCECRFCTRLAELNKSGRRFGYDPKEFEMSEDLHNNESELRMNDGIHPDAINEPDPWVAWSKRSQENVNKLMADYNRAAKEQEMIRMGGKGLSFNAQRFYAETRGIEWIPEMEMGDVEYLEKMGILL